MIVISINFCSEELKMKYSLIVQNYILQPEIQHFRDKVLEKKLCNVKRSTSDSQYYRTAPPFSKNFKRDISNNFALQRKI